MTSEYRPLKDEHLERLYQELNDYGSEQTGDLMLAVEQARRANALAAAVKHLLPWIPDAKKIVPLMMEPGKIASVDVREKLAHYLGDPPA